MAYLFYFFAIIAIIHELMVLKTTKKYRDKLQEIKAFDYKRGDKQPEGFLRIVLFHILYFLWAFTGLITSQWFLFGALIIISLIPWSKIGTWAVKFDALISIIILLAIIINKFHLHYTITF